MYPDSHSCQDRICAPIKQLRFLDTFRLDALFRETPVLVRSHADPMVNKRTVEKYVPVLEEKAKIIYGLIPNLRNIGLAFNDIRAQTGGFYWLTFHAGVVKNGKKTLRMNKESHTCYPSVVSCLVRFCSFPFQDSGLSLIMLYLSCYRVFNARYWILSGTDTIFMSLDTLMAVTEPGFGFSAGHERRHATASTRVFIRPPSCIC